MTYKLPEGRTIRVLFHVCAVQKPILSLGCLAQQGYWSDLWYTVVASQDPDETQPNTVAKRREFVLCQRDVDCARVDSWCE